ncbi:MAG: response regulator [Azospira oryzae]|jgi:CheY-like chemotaxis protein|nr:MAG: response regulator [Azospira oryzae]
MNSPADTQYLIIDDNEIDQLVTGKLLRTKLGATRIQVFNNGKEGLDWMMGNADPNLAIVVFLDIKMPMMNGFEFMDRFKKLSENIKSRSRIFMLSSTLDPEEIERAIRYEHVDTILEKPLSIDQLSNLTSN